MTHRNVHACWRVVRAVAPARKLSFTIFSAAVSFILIILWQCCCYYIMEAKMSSSMNETIGNLLKILCLFGFKIYTNFGATQKSVLESDISWLFGYEGEDFSSRIPINYVILLETFYEPSVHNEQTNSYNSCQWLGVSGREAGIHAHRSFNVPFVNGLGGQRVPRNF